MGMEKVVISTKNNLLVVCLRWFNVLQHLKTLKGNMLARSSNTKTNFSNYCKKSQKICPACQRVILSKCTKQGKPRIVGRKFGEMKDLSNLHSLNVRTNTTPIRTSGHLFDQLFIKQIQSVSSWPESGQVNDQFTDRGRTGRDRAHLRMISILPSYCVLFPFTE